MECDEPAAVAWAVGDPGHPIGDLAFTLRPDGADGVLEQWGAIARFAPA